MDCAHEFNEELARFAEQSRAMLDSREFWKCPRVQGRLLFIIAGQLNLILMEQIRHHHTQE
jgi:hypothetical protein